MVLQFREEALAQFASEVKDRARVTYMTNKKDDRAVEARRTPITGRPAFDPAQFARDSETTLRAEDSSTRPTLAPPPSPADAGPEVVATSLDLDLGAVLAEEVPMLVVGRRDLDWHDLDPIATALMLRVNGHSTVAAISTASGIPLDDACGVFEELARRGLVRWQ